MKLLSALQRRFKPPEWAMFREVGNSTGMRCNRHADVIAMNLWPSRGLEIVGVECKASRSDWVRERDNPEKADDIAKFCDRWYLAVTDAKIVAAGELPKTWGLLVLRGDSVVETVEAPKLEAVPLTRGFIAALLRRSSESNVSKAELAAAERKGYQEGHEAGERIGTVNAKYGAKRLENLEREVAAFKTASGIDLGAYCDGKELGELVKLIGTITSRDGRRSHMNKMRREAQSAIETAQKIIEAADAIQKILHPEMQGNPAEDAA